MRAILTRLRRLENARVPQERQQLAAAAILESRRRRLGANYEPPEALPPGSFDGCHTIADGILRAHKLRMEREAARNLKLNAEMGSDGQ
jgi:hypothetical protein